eukprot:3334230-Pleurochrysis_carterae.AAC.1
MAQVCLEKPPSTKGRTTADTSWSQAEGMKRSFQGPCRQWRRAGLALPPLRPRRSAPQRDKVRMPSTDVACAASWKISRA